MGEEKDTNYKFAAYALGLMVFVLLFLLMHAGSMYNNLAVKYEVLDTNFEIYKNAYPQPDRVIQSDSEKYVMVPKNETPSVRS